MKRALLFTLCILFVHAASAEPPGLRVWTARPPAGAEETPSAPPENSSEEATAAAGDPSIQQLLGSAVVIDPTHIAETIRNIQQGYQRYLELVKMAEKARRNLERLATVPFVDGENFTGAFLANMHWLLAGGNHDETHPELVEETLGYSHPEIVELLGEYFPGPRIVPGVGDESLRPDPWKTYANPAELYFARDNAMLSTAYRVAEILENHAAQVSRERSGIAWQRDRLEGADGNAQHLEMLFAALHQSLDAQSVERQVNLLGANLQYLAFADQVNARLEARTRIWHHITGLQDVLAIEDLRSAGGTRIGLRY